MCIYLYIYVIHPIYHIYISSHFPLQKQHPQHDTGTFEGVRSSGMGGTEESLDTSRGGGVAGAKAFTLGGWVGGFLRKC